MNVVVLAKVASRRVPRKNVRPFCGSSLLEIAIRGWLACSAEERHRVLLYGPADRDVLTLRDKYDLEFVYEPPEVENTDGLSEMMQHMCAAVPFIQAGEDFVRYTVTNPLFSSHAECVANWPAAKAEGFNSLVAVHQVPGYMLNENFGPMNFPGFFNKHVTSPHLRPVYQLAFDWSAMTPDSVVEADYYLFGSKPKFLPVPGLVLDIDTEDDFSFAERIYEQYGPRW